MGNFGNGNPPSGPRPAAPRGGGTQLNMDLASLPTGSPYGPAAQPAPMPQAQQGPWSPANPSSPHGPYGPPGAAEGSGQWVPPVPTGAARASQKKSSAPLLAGCGAVLALSVVAGGGAAVWALVRANRVALLPESISKLPNNTGFVLRNTVKAHLVERYGTDERDAVRWSYLSRMCGGSDVYYRLVHANRPYTREALARELREETPNIRQALACGKELYEARTSEHETFALRFTDKSSNKFVVTLYATSAKTIDALPKYLIEKTESGKKVYCKPAVQNSGECTDSSFALARVAGHWAAGDMKDIRAYLSEFSVDGNNEVKESAAIKKVARELESHEYARVHSSATSELLFFMGFGYHGVKLDDEVLKRLQDSIDNGSRSFGYGETQTSDGANTQFVVEAKNDAGAKAVENALREYVRGVGQKASGQAEAEAKEIPYSGEQPSEFQWRKARREISRRGLAAAKISRDELRVTMTIDLKASAADKSVRTQDLAARAMALSYGTKVVEKLYRGEAVTDEDLGALGGPQLVAEVKNPVGVSQNSNLPAKMRQSVEVPGLNGFRVPSGGSYRFHPKDSDTNPYHDYNYGISYAPDSALATIEWTEQMNTKNGWSCHWDRSVAKAMAYDCSKGANEVRYILGKLSDGSMFYMVVDKT